MVYSIHGVKARDIQERCFKGTTGIIVSTAVYDFKFLAHRCGKLTVSTIS